MSLLKKSRSSDGVSTLRIISVVLVLGMLVLAVGQSAKYLYVLKIPKSVSSKIEPSVDKLAAVLGAAKTSLESVSIVGDILTTEDEGGSSSVSAAIGEPIAKEVVARVAILSDSHNDLEYLQKAVDRISELKIDQIVFLGDYTDWGELTNLEKSRVVMASAKIPFVSVPGDHDLGETRDESNFRKIFGSGFGILELNGIKLMYFDNSKNYTTIKEDSMKWFDNEITDTEYLFLAQPLLTASMDRVMGIISSVKDEAVFTQNLKLLDNVRRSKVRVIISGDLHQFSQFDDPVKKELTHYSIGAILKSQSLEKLNFQSPRFSVLTVYDNDSYTLDDIVID